MRIAIIGSGAMGCLYGGKLACVTDVWLIDPWRDHVEAIRRDGLKIVEPNGEVVVKVPATTDPAEVGLVDLGIIFVKSHQTPWAGEIAKSILTSNGLALTMQNGLGNRDTLAEIVGPDRAWQGVTSHGATMLGPGRIRHAGTGPTYLQMRQDIAETAETVANLFQQAELETHLSDDVDGLIWSKLVINVGINALTAIMRVQNGVLAQNEAAMRIMDRAVEEAVQVAKAKEIKLPYDNPVERVRSVAGSTGQNRSSMLQDVLRGSRTEIGVINGAIVREAAKLGIPAPVNELLTDLVQALETSNDARVQ